MPNIVSTSVVLLFATILVGPIMGSGSGAHSKYAAPVDGPLSRLIFSLFMIAISLPVVVISNRRVFYDCCRSRVFNLKPTIDQSRPHTDFPGLMLHMHFAFSSPARSVDAHGSSTSLLDSSFRRSSAWYTSSLFGTHCRRLLFRRA